MESSVYRRTAKTHSRKRDSVLSINPESLDNLGEVKGTKEAIEMLNTGFSKAFNRTFIDTVIDYGKQGVQVNLSTVYCIII